MEESESRDNVRTEKPKPFKHSPSKNCKDFVASCSLFLTCNWICAIFVCLDDFDHACAVVSLQVICFCIHIRIYARPACNQLKQFFARKSCILC